MIDIVERLREQAKNGFRGQATADDLRLAADEIERLKARIAELEASSQKGE